MIYLFEDRDDRKRQFFGEEELHPLICQKPFDCSCVDDIDDYIVDNFSDAIAVLLHKSYSFVNDRITIDSVKNSFKFLLDIPVVLFSGGSKSSLIKEGDIITAEINSGVMYRNLNLFIESYQQDGKVCIPILVYGKYYQINQLLEMQAKINAYLFGRNENDKDSNIMSEKDKRRIMQILRDVSDDSLATDIEKLKNWINEKDEGLPIPQLLQAVQNLIKKYRV